MLSRQIDNYREDPRAVFVYTFTPQNIDEARQVADTLAATGQQVTFNMFSAPVGYEGTLRHTADSLGSTARMMAELMADFPQTVLFSHYNITAHTSASGLHALFSCTYPRRNPSTAIGLGRSFRQYHTDLRWDREAACCVPDTDCEDCRHYAAGSAVVTARMFRHAIDAETFPPGSTMSIPTSPSGYGDIPRGKIFSIILSPLRKTTNYNHHYEDCQFSARCPVVRAL